MWVKVSGIGSALQAGNLKLHLDNGTVTADGNDKESLNIPGVSPDTWTFVRMSLGNPESDSAIASIGLEHDADLGAGVTVWLDDISVVRNDTSYWRKIPRNLWKIDREANDIVFDEYLDGLANYNLLKIVGGDKPALLSADSTASEIDDSYIIERSTALAFSASSGGPNTDPDARRQQAAFWFGLSQASKRRFPMLTNVRSVT